MGDDARSQAHFRRHRQAAGDATSSAREEILSNPIYRELSTAVAGSQELSAIAKLYELHHERDFDVIVLDTPPSRNAMDFLDAPTRLLGFLEGRALKVFIAPGGLTARLFGRPTALSSRSSRASPASTCSPTCPVLPLGLGRDRGSASARGVAYLLREPSTTFLIVTSPEPEPAPRRSSSPSASKPGTCPTAS